MNKITNHIKNNFAIYAVLLTCLVITLIAIFVTSKPKVEKATVDTSMLTVIDVKQANKLFDDISPKLLVISTTDCSVTATYVSSLKIVQAKRGYNTYFLSIDDLDLEDKEVQELLSKLDIEYNLKGKVGKFGDFIGATPMTVIIKNKKMVHGYIGNMSTSSLETITDLYGV